MTTTVNAITEWIRTLGSTSLPADGGTEPATASEAVAEDETASSLFQCPECQSVYVAVEKTTCTGCETSVDRVASSLSASD